MFKKIILYLILGVIILLGYIGIKTITAPNLQRKIKYVPAPELTENAVQHFRQAIQIKTVSYDNPTQWDSLPFMQFRQFLEKTYPLVHQHLDREIINGYSYLYQWKGKNPALAPYILMAHQDVVPIEEKTRNLWTCEPFGGTIKDGYIWGRGTTDDKINLISILESAEKLLQQGFQPQRTIYFSFGHDEEISGKNGAKEIAKLLASRNVKAELILDEGGFITQEKVPGLKKPVALIGTAEKGYMSIDLTVTKKGGHSSMPEKETAIDILIKAISQLRANPFEAKFAAATQDFMHYIGPEMKFPNNMAMANPVLFKKLICKNYEKSGSGNAMIRTTSVPTIINSGLKENVIPTMATATINFRLLPGDFSKDILKAVKEIIHDDRVKITIRDNNINEGTTTTSATGNAFILVDSIAKSSYDKILGTPFLLIGATDSRYFTKVSSNIIKFSPMFDPIGFHGIDERVSLHSFQHALWFYEQLIHSSK
ncbi:MAG TPA: M20/M25/M40 family metallo-hydrolase [Chitinophagales bacterium]|nr:M20/M25/M40 family metallo-hydrolase [Chitinophagales bacterium]HNM31355.1 M20/M25/M40 family metallo-hydrolase [Chitinophagales bacterium]